MRGQEQEASGKQKTKEIKPPPKALELAVFVALSVSGVIQYYMFTSVFLPEAHDKFTYISGHIIGALLIVGPLGFFFLRKRLNIYTRNRTEAYSYDPRSHRFLFVVSLVNSVIFTVVVVLLYFKKTAA